MKPVVKKILIGVGAVVGLFVAVGFVLPSSYETSRSVEIDAPPEVVFELVNHLPSNERWSPWKEADPTIEETYSEAKSGVGAYYTWTSEKMGEGRLEIKVSEPHTRIENALNFGQQLPATGTWSFEAVGDAKTKVTWGISGENGMNPINRWFGLVMDSLVGADFERGLGNLKRVAESEAKAPAP